MERRRLFLVGLGLMMMFVVGKAQFNFDENGGFNPNRPKFCRPYICRKEDTEVVPKRQLKLISQGSCSGLSSGGISMMGQNKDKELDSCCDARHACNNICGTSLKMCEDIFESCLNATCATSINSDECSKNANMYKLIGSLSDGCKKHEPGQDMACECLPSEKAQRRRTQILSDIYKKYSPDSIEKVQSLTEKANTPKKFANLLARLVTKFPSMIQVQVDPQQAYFENLMKQSKAEAAASSSNDKEDNVVVDEIVDGLEDEEDHIEL